MKKFNTLRLDLAEKTLTPAEKKKREEIAKAMERENPGMPMGKKMAIATATAKRVVEENLDEEYEDSGEEHPKMWKHVSSVDSNTWSGVAKHHGKNLSNVVHDLEKERDSIKKKGGNHNATSNHDHAIMQLKQHLPSTAKKVAEENLDEISTKLLAKAASAASDPDSDYSYGKSHDPQKFADHANKTKDAKSAAAVQGAADAKGHYVRPGHTLGSYDKLAHRTPARVTGTGKANKQDVKTLKGSIKRNEEVESIDEISTKTLDSYITRVATGPSRGNTQTGIPKSIKAIGGVTTALRKKAENNNPPFEPDAPKKNPSALAGKRGIGPSIAAHLAKKGMKQQMKEEIKTTHEDPLVVTKDSDGNIHTHANLSVANAIHGTDVKHQAIHTGMPVQAGKFTFELSKHHASEVKEANEEVEIVYEANIEPTSAKSRSHIGNLSNPIVNSVVHSGKQIGLITKQPNGKYHAHHSAAKLAHAQGGTFDTKDKAHQFVRDAHAKAIQNGTLKSNRMSEAKEKTEYDYEGDMARGQLQSIIMNAQRVHDMLKDNDNLPEWVQSKITLAEDYISTVSNYMASEIDEMHLSFGSQDKKPVPVTSKLADMKKYFATNDKDQIKQKITGKKFHDMSEYEAWMKSNKTKSAMQVASFEQGDENKLDEISSNTLKSYMKAAHTKYSNIENKNDPASVAKKEKTDKGIKTAYKKLYPPKKSEPEQKVDMSSAGSYYASKKPGQYTGD